jgi:hypothetical protein
MVARISHVVKEKDRYSDGAGKAFELLGNAKFHRQVETSAEWAVVRTVIENG